MAALATGVAAAGALALPAGPASADTTDTVTVTVQVTRNSVGSSPSVVYSGWVGYQPGMLAFKCAGKWGPGFEATPTFEVVAYKGWTIHVRSVSGCYSGRGVGVDVVADATKTVQVAL
jgi:hypothetical protein